MSEWSEADKDRRDEMVRERFAAVADEFIALIDKGKSGHVLIHFQHGLPGKAEWRMKGEIPRRGLTPTGDW